MPTIEDILNRVPLSRNKEIVIDRLNGCSLMESCEKYGITNSRILYIQKEVLYTKDMELEEEKYQWIFDEYHITPELFCSATGLSKLSYQYLMFTMKKTTPKKTVFELWSDNRLKKLNIDIKKVMQTSEIPILTITRNDRDEIIRMILQSEYTSQRTLDELLYDYYEFLNQYHCVEQKPMVHKAFINKMETSQYTLLSRGRRIRYYNLLERDFCSLLDKLHLDQYRGHEYSTLKFYREQQSLFKEYDIRDEYELHNLLRKLAVMESYSSYFKEVNFGRMPIIRFGKQVDRKRQVVDLIDGKDLSLVEAIQLYEDTYGVRAASLITQKDVRENVTHKKKKIIDK